MKVVVADDDDDNDDDVDYDGIIFRMVSYLY